jgi:hypothetical protein
MTRLILLIALVAVGYDAYAFQGYYTRAAVSQVETGIQRLSATTGDTRTGDGPASKPPAP